jgi:23S rRNA pseudouridine2605 synthase
MAKKRLNKALSEMGVASRRKAEELIFAKRVKVNNCIVILPQTLVDLEKDKILVDESPVKQKLEKLYFLLNKPAGYLCSEFPIEKQKLVKDLFPPHFSRLLTLGRLDKQSSGLIVVTNDGDFIQKTVHALKNTEQEYLVKVNEQITADDLKELADGVFVDGYKIKPIWVKKMRNGILKICMKEGKKQEIGLLCEKADFSIREIKRIRIGHLFLGTLPEGAYKPTSLKSLDF